LTTIVFDTETTSLLAPMAASQEFQPHLVEIAAIKLDDSLTQIDKLHLRCKPRIPIPEEAIKIHNITNDDVKDCPAFVGIYKELCEFFLGSTTLVGHNCIFDRSVVYWELFRLGKSIQFPWPMNHVCTAEISSQMQGFRLTLQDLHLQLFGEIFYGAHSAQVDCEITAKCYRKLVEMQMVKEW
jgi:DNA polymerase-3 subunit epsilon